MKPTFRTSLGTSRRRRYRDVVKLNKPFHTRNSTVKWSIILIRFNYHNWLKCIARLMIWAVFARSGCDSGEQLQLHHPSWERSPLCAQCCDLQARGERSRRRALHSIGEATNCWSAHLLIGQTFLSVVVVIPHTLRGLQDELVVTRCEK